MMSETVIRIRTVGRFFLALALTGGLVLTLFLLVRELRGENIPETLSVLLGGGVLGLATALNSVVQAVASNPSDRNATERE